MSRLHARRRAKGLTLIELMVALVILGILTALAAPSFASLIAGSHASQAVNSFVSDMRFARGEGMRRGKNVSICRSAAPSDAVPVCSTGAGEAAGGWMEGWVVFVDENGNGSFDTGDKVLRVQNALAGLANFYAVGTGAPSAIAGHNYVVYDANGRAVGYMGRWLVRPAGALSQNAGQVRTLCLNVVGRVQTFKGDVACK